MKIGEISPGAGLFSEYWKKPTEMSKSGAIYSVIHPHSQVHATPDHLLTDKTAAVRDSCKHCHRKNKLALQLVGKPSDNANNRVSSISKEGSPEG
jgi:hypothetical protein